LILKKATSSLGFPPFVRRASLFPLSPPRFCCLWSLASVAPDLSLLFLVRPLVIWTSWSEETSPATAFPQCPGTRPAHPHHRTCPSPCSTRRNTPHKFLSFFSLPLRERVGGIHWGLLAFRHFFSPPPREILSCCLARAVPSLSPLQSRYPELVSHDQVLFFRSLYNFFFKDRRRGFSPISLFCLVFEKFFADSWPPGGVMPPLPFQRERWKMWTYRSPPRRHPSPRLGQPPPSVPLAGTLLALAVAAYHPPPVISSVGFHWFLC